MNMIKRFMVIDIILGCGKDWTVVLSRLVELQITLYRSDKLDSNFLLEASQQYPITDKRIMTVWTQQQ
jgi:hypothetical protein